MHLKILHLQILAIKSLKATPRPMFINAATSNNDTTEILPIATRINDTTEILSIATCINDTTEILSNATGINDTRKMGSSFSTLSAAQTNVVGTYAQTIQKGVANRYLGDRVEK